MSKSPSRVPWNRGSWTHPPKRAVETDGELHVTAVHESDAWRHTSYGFVHDSEHALVAPFNRDEAMEVTFGAKFAEQFDQAGIFVRVSAEHWVKAGAEYVDGSLNLGVVVTDGHSDWSVASAPSWVGYKVTVRVSWRHDALTVRASREGDQARLLRVVPFRPRTPVEAGPYVCAPTRAGLTVPFYRWIRAAADQSLHAK